MSDICTLIVATATTLQMCYSQNICHPSRDGTKQICSGIHSTVCPGIPVPTYECKRDDGSTYIWTDSLFQETPSIQLEQGTAQ